MNLAIRRSFITKRNRYSVEQMIAAVKQHEAGARVPEAGKVLGINQGLLWHCKEKYDATLKLGI